MTTPDQPIALKVCGMRHTDNIEALVEQVQPDYMGLIFNEKSPRHAEQIADAEYLRSLKGPKKTGVFVNADSDYVERQIERFGLDALQLHGQESPEYCERFAKQDLEIIKVFSVGNGFDFGRLAPYEEIVDYFLFDTKGKQPGGNGVVFNWEILEDYPSDTPFFLSGGISLEDKDRFAERLFPQLYAIDVNSRFEIEPGRKDIEQLAILKQYLDNTAFNNPTTQPSNK
ncbi:MAG: phosphoribosylanthranilate isomerase [Bacteroidota bacterium]